MSLLLGLGLTVMNSKESNHSLLMRYYEIDKTINDNYDKDSEIFDQIFELKKKDKEKKLELERQRSSIDLQNLFLYTEARVILLKLGIQTIKN